MPRKIELDSSYENNVNKGRLKSVQFYMPFSELKVAIVPSDYPENTHTSNIM